MKLSQFKFKLPEELVALYPPHRAFENEDGTVDRVYNRDQCKLMVVHRKSGKIEIFKKDADGNDTEEFMTFRNLLDYFDEGDTFIFNDTKVFPARLYGTKEKTDAQIEVFLLRELNEELRLWDVLVEPARKIRIGNKLFFDGEGPRELFSLGEAPLPRYIVDRRKAEPDDMEQFQTIFAKNEGAVTAPATGLHFSRELMKMMEIRGYQFAYLTVHCSLGSFDPIEVEDLTKHKMNSEQVEISPETCEIVNRAKTEGHHICAVGVSTMRATESSVGTDGMLKEFSGWTNKFIFPPYDFGLADSVITNFYHPESTMMMATAAFAGYELTIEAYKIAIKNGFKFGCYGDAMLVVDD